MSTNRKISAISFTAVFFIVIALLGVVSFAKLIKFYVNDEVDYNEWNADLDNKLETDIATCFYGKFDFVSANGAVRNLLGQREMNGVVKLNNGYLLTTNAYVDDDLLRISADGLCALKEYLEDRDIKLIYAITPYTSSKYDPQLPIGVEDYGNDNLDRLAGMLEADGIEVIDFREMLHEDGIDQYDMVYRTDHHWNTKMGFYAYSKLAEVLERELDCVVDPHVKDFNNYSVTTYEKWHLGSRGQRTGKYYETADDFDLILPDFETSLSNGNEDGTYESLIIDTSALQSKNVMSRYTYDTTLDRANGNFVNHNSYNDKKLLVLTDSFGKAVNPFLAISFGELRTMNGSVSYDVIDSYQPDAVIVFYYVAYAVDPVNYQFIFPAS